MTPNSEREKLADVLMAHPWLAAKWPKGFCPTCHVTIDAGHNSPLYALHLADAVLAAGYRRQEDTEWEIPHCHLDDWGKLQHSVNCECWGDKDGPLLKRRPAGRWVPVTEEGGEQ